MKVVFLDFDGVINNSSEKDDYIFYPIRDIKDREEFLILSAENIVALKVLVAFLFEEDIKVVLSSSWRLMFSPDELDDALKVILGFGYRSDKLIIASTSIDPSLKNRGEEIKKYLEENNVENYLIIDDIDDFLPEQKKHFIQTYQTKGFTLEDFKKVKKYFLKWRFHNLIK